MKRLLCIVAVGMVLTACHTTKYVPIIETRTDTLIVTKHQRDSIYLKDSTNVHEWQKGDTMYIEVLKWRTEYRERKVHDTIYQSKVDSIPKPYPVEVKVPRELTWWQKTKMRCGVLFMGIMGILGVVGIIRIKRKVLP